MEHVIQTYSAVEVRSVIRFCTVQNHSETEIYEKLCAVYGPQCMSPPYTAHNFCVSLSHYGFVLCKIVLRFELPQHCTFELHAPYLCTGISWHTVPFNLKFLQRIQQLKNLVLPLTWFHFVHSGLCTNLGKLTFEMTFVLKTETHYPGTMWCEITLRDAPSLASLSAVSHSAEFCWV